MIAVSPQGTMEQRIFSQSNDAPNQTVFQPYPLVPSRIMTQVFFICPNGLSPLTRLIVSMLNSTEVINNKIVN